AAAAEAASGADGAGAVREPAPEGVDRAGVVDLGRLRFGPVRRHEGDWEEGEAQSAAAQEAGAAAGGPEGISPEETESVEAAGPE
ncbi:MAG: hypothetical protein ABEJ46_03235, partial [Gemmatimonadota bacterium]